ncbi:HEAT repeat domain-containing protein [Candidatus Entotheonella palauensis]|uniref:HEAT repeat domain-containing protein n=1 Tax=Candidatus Entotheonella palauensis TaxID=93172 RepID=UPI000B7C9183|nr:HEAT repeat domain-containing protein [Candidatus Entotheonella palauensis]
MEIIESRAEVIEAISTQLQQDNDRTRWSAVKALSQLGARTAAPTLMAQLHRDPDPDVRMEMASALGRLGTEDAVEALICTLYEDPDEDVRLQACRALGQLGSPHATQVLIDCLTGDVCQNLEEWEFDDDIDFGATWELQREALEGLGALGDTHAVEAIILFMVSGERDDLEELSLQVLAAIGGERALQVVLRQLRAESPRTRRWAARALASVDEPMSRQPLIDALQDQEADVRVAAGWALMAQYPDALSPYLFSLLKDPDAIVRLEGAKLIATSQHDAVTDHLIRLLDDPNRDVQLQVIQLLEDRLEPRAISPMLTLLSTSSTAPELSAALIRALGVLQASEALVPICQLLEAEPTSSLVRLQAALALGDIAEAKSQQPQANVSANQVVGEVRAQPDPAERLLALVNDEDPQVGRAALRSLGKLGRLTGDVFEPSVLVNERIVDRESPRYPTSTLEAIEQSVQLATSEVAAARQREMRHEAARLLDGARSSGVDQVVEPIGLDQNAERVMAKLHDTDRHGQRAALDTLVRLQDRSVIEALRHFLFANGGALWPETLSTLRQLNDSGLCRWLLMALKQPEQEENHWIAIEVLQ